MKVPPSVAVVPVVIVTGAEPSMLPLTSRLVPVAAPMFGVVKAGESSGASECVPLGKVELVAAVVVSVSAFAPTVISELPVTSVSVAEVPGAVMVTLLIEVAVATPSVGVVKLGESSGARL